MKITAAVARDYIKLYPDLVEEMLRYFSKNGIEQHNPEMDEAEYDVWLYHHLKTYQLEKRLGLLRS